MSELVDRSPGLVFTATTKYLVDDELSSELRPKAVEIRKRAASKLGVGWLTNPETSALERKEKGVRLILEDCGV